jgi:plastocyanin
MNRSRLTLIAAACAATLLLGACGGSSDSGSSTQADSGAMGSTQPSGGGGVSIKNFAYVPPSLTVSKGTTVKFTNSDTTEHTATASGGAFDTGSIAAGKTQAVTLDDSGTFSYVCTFHPFMHGTIIVK